MEDTVAGIDVGKWRLDVSVSQGPVRSFDNTPEGIAAPGELGSEQRCK